MFDDGEPTAAVGAEGTDRRDCSSATDVVARLAAGYRAIATAQAAFLRAVVDFARARPALVGEQVVAGASEFAIDEMAAELRLSRRAAGAYLHLAMTLAEHLPGTAAALASGAVDLPKARLLTDATGVLDAPVAAAVEDQVLPKAPAQTVGQLRAQVERAVLAVDPDGAQVRHERAVVDRRVVVTPQPDGMAELWAMLPAPAASAVYAAIDRHARRPGHPVDVPMDARRADALVDLVTAHATTGGPAHGGLVADRLARAGLPADRSARGGLSADHAARGRPATDHVRAGGPTSDEVAGDPAAAAATSAPLRSALAPLIQVTVPASTLLRLDDQPAELAGHGPIPAEVARQLAADPTGTWRRVLTDPATGTVLDVGHRSYRPPRPLARYVTARDATCRFPGCRQPAHRCDLDHVTPWPDGPTSAANLITLCRHHHGLKHSDRWHVTAARDGTVTWTAPTGRTYSTRPPPIADPTADERSTSTDPLHHPRPLTA